jgi:hypothetical protein
MYHGNKQFDLETTAKFWLLQIRGIRISYYGKEGYSAIDWCTANVKGHWGWNHEPELIKNSDIVKNIDYHFTGIWPKAEEDDETRMMNAMARQLQQDIDDEILEKLGVKRIRPSGYFWFDNNDDAMLFKLTWGGE